MRCFILFALALFVTGCAHALHPPTVPTEFRAAWVATVDNIDWPSKPGLSVEQQRQEMRAILDRAVSLHLNAIIFQVRTSADALYASPYEPWSEYLTGRQGHAASPLYDPLREWIDEAHRRGIELHAWFNPFRARMAGAKGERAANHVSRLHPQWVKQYGPYEWLDPGEQGAQEYTLRVILDVVRRYDIDGVHIDDYFYPYPIKGHGFPDDASWNRYLHAGGKLSRADWRRANIDRFIQRLYQSIKREKRWVKFGISPFGIWKPGHPPGVKGFSQYDSLYADARRWLKEGWCDYFTPQLYWRIESPAQSFPDLLDWWKHQNDSGRHLWPGLDPSRIIGTEKGWPAQEIVSQIAVTRLAGDDAGEVHFSMKALMQNRGGIADALREGPYAQPAVVPASPWLGRGWTPAPWVRAKTMSDGGVSVTWGPQWFAMPWVWVLSVQRGDEWATIIYPAATQECMFAPRPGSPIHAMAVRLVDRLGNQSPPTTAVVP